MSKPTVYLTNAAARYFNHAFVPNQCLGCGTTGPVKPVWNQADGEKTFLCRECCDAVKVLPEVWDWNQTKNRLEVKPTNNWLEKLVEAAYGNEFLNSILGTWNRYQVLTEKQFLAANKQLLRLG